MLLEADPKKERHSIENARNHPLWPKFEPAFTLNPKPFNYSDGKMKHGIESDSSCPMNINASQTVKCKTINGRIWTFV